ncbi:MAG: hypothetical protein ACT4PK_10535 [Gammaproteobacteria bacterium]
MRILTFLIGMVAVTGASAGEYDARALESDAVAAQVVYRVQFGGAAGAPVARSFALQVGNEGQRLAGVAPLQAEYRHDTGQFLLNGIDVERSFVMRQEEGGIAAIWGGWLPLAIVVGAAALIIVDGQDQTGP